ncbi:hypothetical protein COCNU_04G002160 [Cocos nucifera]|uniref:Uncharacterized protein n=1 Tax=Cocos nucifera TaxID=13894 RepID=A0A8K0MZB9_COCNU|nr:hypothetical protein COCNU_04G002160 [Cocos nucifera]
MASQPFTLFPFFNGTTRTSCAISLPIKVSLGPNGLVGILTSLSFAKWYISWILVPDQQADIEFRTNCKSFVEPWWIRQVYAKDCLIWFESHWIVLFNLVNKLAVSVMPRCVKHVFDNQLNPLVAFPLCLSGMLI